MAVADEHLLKSFPPKAVLAAWRLNGVNESFARPAPDRGIGHVELARNFTGCHPVVGPVLATRNSASLFNHAPIFLERCQFRGSHTAGVSGLTILGRVHAVPVFSLLSLFYELTDFMHIVEG